MRSCIIIGHRGASNKAPENTLLSFQKAWELGADMVELDVHESSDGRLVCIHDYDVSRTTNGTGLVSEMTLRELQELDAGDNQQIPLLEDVLGFARGKVGVNIELKTIEIEEEVLRITNEAGMLEEVIFSSFLHEALRVIRELEPKAITAILLNNRIDEEIPYALELGAKAINPRFFNVDKDLVDAAHTSGLKVYPWTVNDEEFMLELLHMGVDGLITDLPDLGVRVVDSFLRS
ncbi:MAG: glycerophosphodiester phosphodiesterase [Candidatus Thorarchaeota archaeon]|nr:glycerophosphodiester phosphodiesterase [Candidatus Thorarchaeota archaeon]